MPVYYRGLPHAPTNPFVRALAAVAGLGLFVLMVFLGMVFLAAFAALAVLAWAGFQVRRWWLTRHDGGGRSPGVVDAEYRVVERRDGRGWDDN